VLEFVRTRRWALEVPEVVASSNLVDKIGLGDVFSVPIPDPPDLDANYRVVATEL
jgi:hypothetical protein